LQPHFVTKNTSGLIKDFPTKYEDILARVEQIDPVKYSDTRNYIDGDVSYLSPYISRGVISTKQVFRSLMNRGFNPRQIEKFIQELAWRDYWQQVWVEKREEINSDLKRPQPQVENEFLPHAIITAETGISAIDHGIMHLYSKGYMHNHVRMYVAALACNVARSHWRTPARWMYYHLIDGDWASNALSWQWVAGSNSNKKYVANQENINKYCRTNERNTYLDIPYDDFEELAVPDVLRDLEEPAFFTELPAKAPINIDPSKPTLIYNYYNLDPTWREGQRANRIVLLEPSVFAKYPISKRVLNFTLELVRNIPEAQIFVGEYDELMEEYDPRFTAYKEHPLNAHYEGQEEPRDWMFNVRGYYSSFYGFWKECEKDMASRNWN
jgi:deoxyribodipyrimidine photo-lyase